MHIQPIVQVWWHDRQWSRLVSLVRDKAQHKQSISMDLGNSYQYSNVLYPSWADCCVEVHKKIFNSNPNLVKSNSINMLECRKIIQTQVACMFISGHFHVMGMRNTRKYISCVHWNRKAQAASAQSFTLWQQATREVTWQNRPITCSPHIHLCVALLAHYVRGESHFQRNTNWEVTATSYPFWNELHQSYVLFVKVSPGTTYTLWSLHHFVATGKPKPQVRKVSHCGSKQE